MNPQAGTAREAASFLWRNNMGLAQLLGLCPLLAVTTSVVNGLALGLATAAVVTVASTTMALLGGALVRSLRLALCLLILAALVTALDLYTNALFYDLHEALGLFMPLIVVNSGVIAHAGGPATERGVWFGFVSGVATGLGFLFVLVLLGALREVVGRGTLFGGIETLGGESSAWLVLDVPSGGMMVAVLPPGAFLGLALLLALRNRLAMRSEPSAAPATERAQ
jgi:electron transport complex protein RnfE